ncbi:hypothetical protein GCM10020000_60080 [Streptomyces olivoverticillatus]
MKGGLDEADTVGDLRQGCGGRDGTVSKVTGPPTDSRGRMPGGLALRGAAAHLSAR